MFTLIESNPKGSAKRIRTQTLKAKAAKISNLMKKNNFCVVDNFLGRQTVSSLRSELAPLHPHFTPSEIWVGAGSDLGAQITVPSIRGDKVLWMCGGHTKVDSTLFDSAGVQPKGRGAIEPCDMNVKGRVARGMGSKEDDAKEAKKDAADGVVTIKPGVSRISTNLMSRFSTLKMLLESIDTLVFGHLSQTDPRLSRVTSRSDAMLAVYPGGGSRFQRHVDNTAQDGRRLTVLIYLNEDGWEEKDGGMLRIWGKDETAGEVSGRLATDVLPTGGRVAMFYSDFVAHEVTSSNKPRVAMTVWYYDSLERSEAVARAQEMEADKGEEKGDMEAQNEASEFIKTTLAGEEKSAGGGGGLDLEVELRQVGELAGKLSMKAVKIVAGICGAPSEEAFLQGAKNMTKEGLQDLRDGLRRMGV